jgi:alkylation response protein AidB-like acyl-CoA dehydrogenase
MPMQMTITRAMSIYSGSNEIQRNIIAKRVLNLPD